MTPHKARDARPSARHHVFSRLSSLYAACVDLPPPDDRARQIIATREATSTKPGGSLIRLKDLTAWPGACQRRTAPMLEHVRIVIFAGNHEAVRHGVSPWAARWSAIFPPEPPRSTNSPIWQIRHPAEDSTSGYTMVNVKTDLLCVSEVRIGNTTSAAVLAVALFCGTDPNA